MAQYRKKPVVIDAFQLVYVDGKMDWPGWAVDAMKRGGALEIHGDASADVYTREGTMRGDPGDWIIRGVAGEIYPCKPDIFERTYEAVDTPEFIVGALTDAMLHGQGVIQMTRVDPAALYPGPMCGDRMQYEIENINTKPEDRSDWPLPSFDAQDWAKAFCKIATNLGYKDAEGKPIDEGWMISWFANALMRGYDEGVSRAHEDEPETFEPIGDAAARVVKSLTVGADDALGGLMARKPAEDK